MNRRSLFKGLAAVALGAPFAKAYASAGSTYLVGERGPELHIPRAQTGVLQAGRLTSADGRFSIDLNTRRIDIEARG